MALFNGAEGRDVYTGTADADRIFGNGGNDQLAGAGGDDVIRGGSGQDIIQGDAGNDILFADSNEGGEDVLFGGTDSDILVSGSGRDHFNGGSGVDAASWQDSAVAVVADLSTARGTAGGVEDTFTQVENLIGSRFGDTLRGDGAANGLFGGAGDDRLFGGAGSDHLSGGAGNDVLDSGGGGAADILRGGSGVDTVDYGSLTSRVEVDLDFDGINATSEGRFESLSEIEVIRATSFADLLVGDEFGNQFFGRAGNDVIDGGEGDDILSGGGGADVFRFIAQPAHFLPAVDSGFDRITDYARVEGDLIDLRSHHEASDFAALRADARQVGSDTLIRLGEDAIVIEDLAVADLSASMFLL
jgi:Ca2+-binding RTX toxin-like protein